MLKILRPFFVVALLLTQLSSFAHNKIGNFDGFNEYKTLRDLDVLNAVAANTLKNRNTISNILVYKIHFGSYCAVIQVNDWQ